MSNSFLRRANVVSVAQSCPTLGDPMDCSPPGSSVHGILQARILEWTAMPSSRGSSWPRGWTQVSHVAGRFALLQGILPTQGWNSGLPRCREIFLPPGDLPDPGLNSGLPQCWQIRPPPGDLPDTGWTQVSCIAGRFFTSWAPREQRRHLPRGQQLRLVTGYSADEVLSTVAKSWLAALF